MNKCNICENVGNNVVLFGALVAITLAKDLTLTEQDILGNLLQVIAQNLLSMSGVASDCEAICCNNENNNSNVGTQNTNNSSINQNTNTNIATNSY